MMPLVQRSAISWSILVVNDDPYVVMLSSWWHTPSPGAERPVAGFLDQLSDLELTELPLESEVVEELHT